MSECLLEQIKTTKSLCEIAIILINLGKQDLLPTVLELIYLESQNLIDECIVERNEDE